MFTRSRLLGAFFVAFLSTAQFLEAGWTIQNGKLMDSEEVPMFSAQEHYNLGSQALACQDYREASRHFRIVTKCFPTSSYGQDANYFLGVCYYELHEFDLANSAFSDYIKSKNHPQYFIEAIEYKFCIAEAFKGGAKRRFWGSKQLPKWASGEAMGIEIYDEVIAALPSHDLAAKALYAKGCMKWQMREYRDSIDAFQVLVRRFPKHELCPEAYLCINRVYLDQSVKEFQNPDILAFAELNLKRFKQQFPREERLCLAEQDVLAIKEVYARGLYETGEFYERVGKSEASVIYYQNTVQRFPDTSFAARCIERLRCLLPGYTTPAPFGECVVNPATSENFDDTDDLIEG